MSTYILMKILESAPSRYDQGIYLLTLGKINKVYDHLSSYIKEGQKVLDIGCGTGALAIKAARKGAQVKGIDVNPQMLEIARKKIEKEDLTKNIELQEMGVAELGGEESESYDVVMSGLTFSELTQDELSYTLKEIKRILKPDGILLVADEVKPKSIFKRFLIGLIRFPLLALTYLLTQTKTQSIKNLPKQIEAAGLSIELIKLNRMENFMELVAKKPEGKAE